MNRGKQHISEELLIRYVIGETTEEESVQIREWLAMSNENRLQEEKIRKVWSASANPANIPAADVNVDAAWKNMKSRLDQYKEIEARHMGKRRSLTFYFARIAAMLVIGVLIYTVYKSQVFSPPSVQLSSADSTLTNNFLPDGTVISLNQNTVLEYDKAFSETERKVKLSGEAFFDVEPDKSRPFIIEAQEAVITVLGTSFNVKALAEDIAVEVLVEEGLVELSNPEMTQSTQLRVGEKGIYIKETKEVKKETELDPESLYWLNKTLLFRDTELSVVFETLERLYDVKINVENPDILKCPLTAKFSNESIEHIIDHISTIFELETKKDGDNIVIKGNGCP